MTDEAEPPETSPTADQSAPSTSGLHEPTSRMSRRLLHVTLILILAVPAVVWLLRSPPTDENTPLTGEQVGRNAPDFTLQLFDGTTFNLGQHLTDDGRPVVMNFWASWCVPCREEMPAFDAVAGRNPDVVVLGVAVQDTEPAARAFADEIGVSYPLGHDRDGSILEQYPILGLPATWFIASDRTVAEQWFGQLDENRLQELIDRHLTD